MEKQKPPVTRLFLVRQSRQWRSLVKGTERVRLRDEYIATGRLSFLSRSWQERPFSMPARAEALRRDNPNAEVNCYDTGHFALETHVGEIATAIGPFSAKRCGRKAVYLLALVHGTRIGNDRAPTRED
jgi:hypothetical protein